MGPGGAVRGLDYLNQAQQAKGKATRGQRNPTAKYLNNS